MADLAPQNVIYFCSLILHLTHCQSTSLQANHLRNLLDANFETKDSGFSTKSHSKWMSSLYLFTGLLNTSFPIRCSTNIIPILVPTAILICLENSFWNRDIGSKFVDYF